MNIAGKTPQEILDTEIAHLMRKVEEDMAKMLEEELAFVAKRAAEIKTAMENHNERLSDGAEFFAVKDAVIHGKPADTSIDLMLYHVNDSVRIHQPDPIHGRGDSERRRYRFYLLAYRLPDETP